MSILMVSIVLSIIIGPIDYIAECQECHFIYYLSGVFVIEHPPSQMNSSE